MSSAPHHAGSRRAVALIAGGALALGGALGGLAGLGDDLRAAAQPVTPAGYVPGDELEATTPQPGAAPAARDAAPPTEPGIARPTVTREY